MAEILGEIEFFRGDSYPLSLTVKNKSTKVAIDLTGYSFKLTVDESDEPPDDTTKLFEVDGVLDDDPTTGQVSFTPTETQTDEEIADYYYDIEMIDASGNIRTIQKDKFKIKQDITK